MQPNASPRLIDISPNALLAACALGALVFVAALGKLGAVAFLAFGGILLLRQPGLIVPEMLRYWPIYVIPAFCLLSVFWSDYPDISLRLSVQLGLTFVIAVSIGNRVNEDDFYRVLLVLYSLAMIASLAIGNVRSTGDWLGVFASKNAFAAVASTFTLLMAGLLFGQHTRPLIRIFALGGLALGVFLLIKSNSAGALVLAVAACFMAPLFPLLKKLTSAQRGAMALFAFLACIVLISLTVLFQEQLLKALLEATGKDTTLTGRTDLWASALRLIAERPFLGVGYQAFWIHGNAEAEALWAMFLIESRSGFNFHNTYISNAVEVGLTGVAFQIVLLWGALIVSIIRAFLSPTASAIFAAIFMLQLVMQSFVEVVAFFQFNPRTVIIIALVIHGLAVLNARRSLRPVILSRPQPRAA